MTEDPRSRQSKGRSKKSRRKERPGGGEEGSAEPDLEPQSEPGGPIHQDTLECTHAVKCIYYASGVSDVSDDVSGVSVFVGRQYVSVSQNMEGPRTTLPA